MSTLRDSAALFVLLDERREDTSARNRSTVLSPGTNKLLCECQKAVNILFDFDISIM